MYYVRTIVHIDDYHHTGEVARFESEDDLQDHIEYIRSKWSDRNDLIVRVVKSRIIPDLYEVRIEN